MAIHPTKPHILYLSRHEANLAAIWKGDFSNGNASWTLLPTVPINYSSVTASGGNFILPYNAPNGQFYLFVSDRRTVHISIGEPSSQSDWIKFDTNNAHLDPHGIAIDPHSFQYFQDDIPVPPHLSQGAIHMVNDGGVITSFDGGENFIRGKGLATLGLVNVALLTHPGGAPGICIGMGDNSGYYSEDGGNSWKTQDYLGGDNDCTFSDPKQHDRLLVFAPRHGNRNIFLYHTPGSSISIPSGAYGTNNRQVIPGPPPLSGETKAAWNAISNFYNNGYRPIVHTLTRRIR